VVVYCLVYRKKFFCMDGPVVLVIGPKILVSTCSCNKGVALMTAGICYDVIEVGVV
jgi:hypothetical protein